MGRETGNGRTLVAGRASLIGPWVPRTEVASVCRLEIPHVNPNAWRFLMKVLMPTLHYILYACEVTRARQVVGSFKSRVQGLSLRRT